MCVLSRSSSDVAKYVKRVKLVKMEADDPCIRHHLSPDRAADDQHTLHVMEPPIIEVKYENFPDVKLEYTNRNDMEYREDFSVRVRVVLFMFLTFSQRALSICWNI